jgi:two-component system cell cycle sensor histidine kinase/response regulator CckA
MLSSDTSGSRSSDEDTISRKRSELDGLRSRELLKALVELAPVGIAMFDRNLRYIHNNRRWQTVMAITNTDLSGRYHCDDLRPMPAKWIEAHRRGLAGETVKDEDEWLCPDGKLALHRWEVHPWGDAGMDTGGIIILFEDVTEARAMEAELRHAHKMEALGELAGGVAHDFNNLLQIIQGYTQLLQEQVDGSEMASKFTGEILQAARRASSLTRQLLAFSRRQVFTPVVMDLNDVVRSTLNMLKRLLGEDIDFHLKLEESLWKVEADSDQLSQVLINLCVNVRDAMPYGGSLTVSTRNQPARDGSHATSPELPPGDYVVLTVQDTGTGMKASVLEHIFEPFFTTKDTGKGTGLGLSTVYGIVRQSEGYVWADTSSGLGTRFTVCLPRTGNKPESATGAGAEVSKAAGGDQTVLVVEDDPDVRNVVAEYLPAVGYAVLAADPARALEVAETYDHTIDLLLIDVVMPETSGPVLAAKLRALRPGLRTVFMSGYIDDAVTRHGVLESGEPFLQKPFTLSELTEAIRDALGRP